MTFASPHDRSAIVPGGFSFGGVKKVLDTVNEWPYLVGVRNETMNAAIYLRVSTEEQAESGLGLESQEARCRALVIAKGWELAGVYLERAVSGTSDPRERPEFARLLLDVAAGTVNAVVVLKLDRLARRALWTYQTLAGFETAGVAFVSASEGFDTSTPAGRMMVGLLATFAQFEVEMIKERTKSALAQKKVRGERLGAPVLGLRVDTLADGSKVAVADEAELETVASIVRLRGEGKSLRAIAAILATSGRTTKRGGAWAAETVRLVLERAA